MAMITDYLETIVCCNRNTTEFKALVRALMSSDAQNSFYARSPYEKKSTSV